MPYSPHLKPAPHLCEVTPIQVAAQLEYLGGLVFLDTSGNIPNNSGEVTSIIAAAPSAVHRGSIEDSAAREILESRSQQIDLLGWVNYEGNFVFGEFSEILLYNHTTQTWSEIGNLSQQLGKPIDISTVLSEFKNERSKADYCHAVEQAQEWIAAGDIYQVNLSQRFSAEVSGNGSLFPLYQTLREASPAPMSAYLNLDGKEILSTSPELFLKFDGSKIETRPIKGTRPRFSDPAADRASADELRSSEKESAELIMITDLLRNDLGRICEFGSVKTTKMLELESLGQVHHLVSTIEGKLRENTSVVSALASCFPGGSITGAPKIRSMEIISELERRERGIYCGAIGHLNPRGTDQFNIAIRTLVRKGTEISYHVGAGIVADSDPAGEFLETLQKAEGLKKGIAQQKRKGTAIKKSRLV